MTVKFLSTDEVLAIQERLIDRFGGTHGVRDPGILESALYRPQSGYYQDLSEMSAALFESLLMNHPFLDGNKRVAFFCTDVFLRMNNHFLDVDDDDTYSFFMKLFESSTCDYEHLLPWMKKFIKRI